MRQKIQDSIFRIDAAKRTEFDEPEFKEKFYGPGSRNQAAVFERADPRTCAKEMEKDGKITYAIRLGQAHIIYNPWGVFANEMSYRDIQFQLVSKECFDHYLRFLVSGNVAWLDNAQIFVGGLYG